MKKFLIAAVALFAATTAHAASLPSKKAPLKVPVFATLQNSLSATADFSDGDVEYGLNLSNNLGNGFFVGVGGTTTPDRDNQNAEITAGAKLPVIAGLSLKASGSVGQRFTRDENFPYYVARVGADYALTGRWTWNAIEYRYRNAFDRAYNYESHQLNTGVTYSFNERHSVSAKVYRNYDDQFHKDNDGFLIGYTFKF